MEGADRVRLPVPAEMVVGMELMRSIVLFVVSRFFFFYKILKLRLIE
jgi:hypothetical protein